jgi:polysaccharide deacetylase family protein (PEP-CTERM system associated)
MNILTFDVEEWFHLLDHEATKTPKEWVNYECRIHKNMERILNLLEKMQTKATFFCLGWIAETYPEIAREIVEHGYEIGSHTSFHKLVYEQTYQEFTEDVKRSINVLEDVTGKKVKYFRAPGFSIREDTKWAFEILSAQGIEIDSSIFPVPGSHGGFPSYKEAGPSVVSFNGTRLKELPINYVSLFFQDIIYSGGGYFRLLPYYLIKKWATNEQYFLSYFHPRDFDPDQPMIKSLSLIRKFKSYIGLSGSFKKLEKLLEDFEFVDITAADKIIDWKNVQTVHLD